MNRHQRRLKEQRREEHRLQREGARYGAIQREGVNYAIDILMPIGMYILRKEFGFGEKRLAKFALRFHEVTADVAKKKMSYNVLISEICEGTKIEYDDKDGRWIFPNVREV